jgi:dynein heavy chain
MQVEMPPEVLSYRRRASVVMAASQLKAAVPEFDNPALEPKVQAPFRTRPGEIPRRIQIERRKRLYSAQRIEDLLEERGVAACGPHPSSLTAISPECPGLPIEIFDDESFEVRSAECWLEIAGRGGGALPARALYFLSPEGGNGQGIWRDCHVVGYDFETCEWVVSWLEGGPSEKKEQLMKPRLHVCFRAEDPFNFADRVAAAHAARRRAEESLLCNLYLDCMPADEIAEMDSESTNRIASMCLRGKADDTAQDLSAVLDEVNIDYLRAMNGLALRAQSDSASMSRGSSRDPTLDVLADLPTPPRPGAKREWNTSRAPPFPEFGERAGDFAFNCFLTMPEIIRIMIAVRTEGLRVGSLRLLQTIPKTMRLEEFIAAQVQSVASAGTSVRDQWVTAVSSAVQVQLRDVKKGWFNLEETSNEVYQFSKLRNLLLCINFKMQDTLQFMTRDSLQEFAWFIRRAAALPGDPDGPPPLKVPLFLIELVVEGEVGTQTFAFSPGRLEAFGDAALSVFDKALAAVQGVARVERRVMKKLFWSHDPTVTAIHPSEQWVKDLRQSIASAMERAMVPPRDFLRTIEDLVDFLNLNVDAYLAETEAAMLDPETGCFSFEDAKELLKQHEHQQEAVEERLPSAIALGLYQLNLSKVRKLLSSKHALIVSKLKDLLSQQARLQAQATSRRFQDIYQKLHQPVNNVEDVTDLEDYIEKCDAHVGEVAIHGKDTEAAFHILSQIPLQLDYSCFTLQWEVLGWPSKISRHVDTLRTSLASTKAAYRGDMHEEQASFLQNLKSMGDQVARLSQMTDLAKADQISNLVRRIESELMECVAASRLFNSREALFGDDITDFTHLAEIQRSFDPFCELWKKVDDWQRMYNQWMTEPFLNLDAELVEKEVSGIGRSMAKVARYFEAGGMPGVAAIASSIRAQVNDFAPCVPVILGLRTPGMRRRHWDSLSEAMGRDLHPDENYTLANAMNEKLDAQVELIARVSETASKEYAIESALDKMQAAWESVPLCVEPYRETGTGILKGIDEAMALLDEHITMTQAMTFSSFKGPFEERIESWNSTLQVVSEVLDEWLAVQRNWLYLQPIFDSADINKQLPTEGKRFASVDKHWRATMSSASTNCLAIQFCNNTRLLEKFRESAKLLEAVQKGLSDYLETKRAGFSRFYFLSNDELLEILSQTKDPLRVQPHLKKCFEGIKSVDFADDLTIHAMRSAEGERVEFVSPVDPNGKSIEMWMGQVCDAMCDAVREQMRLGVEDYVTKPRTEWMQQWPGQVVLNGSQVLWTNETETAMREKGNAGIAEYHDQLVAQLNDMVYVIRGDLSKMARLTIGALAVIDVHARDVMQKMAQSGVESATDFDWISQMRFYWRQESAEAAGRGHLKVVMVSSERDYGYEYLGNSMRLVITPLTDKCYLTIMSALQMVLGGAPAGPAGTGKTETTKDLAKALAKQCVVFNCSDGLDYLAMGKFFKGLASSGAWACFDEFNRINIEVLSVIAQQIMTLQGAVQRGERRILFEDTEIVVNPEFAVFITMNPGYAGRSELPDNLEALFRPVAMMVPDYALIAEIMLFSYGYLENRRCAQKMVATFRLCSEQLSSQDHYDYGMRAVKTVITAAGNLKRASPDSPEEALLLRALQDVNVPKFLAHDLPLFDGILGDLFPGIDRPPFDYGPLLGAIKLAAQDRGLIPVPIFMRKAIELYEMICVRHGLMVVGPTGGGKSCNIHVLADALSALKAAGKPGVKWEHVDVHHLNPKSITMGQLYGEFDANTHEWQDGILAGIVRNCARLMGPELQWVLFDGPVDAIWIENMNTVLDDNKKLCLTSGEIMSLSEPMTMMFEPEDLAVASPATVSRCGMIYMEPRSLGSDPLVQSWLAQLPEALGPEHKCRLSSLFDLYLSPTLSAVRRFCGEALPTVDNCLVAGLMNLLDCYLEDFRLFEGVSKRPTSTAGEFLEHLDPHFLFSLLWSVGGAINTEGRRYLSQFLREEMACHGFSRPPPEEGLLYDYFYDDKAGTWVPWMETIEAYQYDPSLSYSELIVPTSDSVRYSHLLDTLVAAGKHVLMCGPTGTGKTVVVQQLLATGGALKEAAVPLSLTFSAQTSANQTQDLIDGKCEKRRKGVFGPAAGKKFLLFVDDINMPQREEYGAQPPVELLRQWFDSGGWYDRKALTFRQLIDTVMVAACAPPGGGRNPMTARFVRHFNVIGLTPLQESAMRVIFSTIFSGYGAGPGKYSEGCTALTGPLVEATLGVFATILSDLRPTPSKSHYTYNLRDLSKVFQGILMCDGRRLSSASDLGRLWVHECTRVFGDRLVDDTDRQWFEDLLKEKLESAASELSWRDVVGEQSTGGMASSSILCADFMVPGADPRVYEEISDHAALQSAVEEYLGEYNADSKQPMHLVMFSDALSHVCRIARVLRQPQGNALLLGVGGSGRQSLTRLATFMLDFSLFQIEISKSYGKVEWHEDLRSCLLKAGADNKSVVFLFSDTQIVEEGMLEDINNILNSGDVPNLYGPEDLERITTACTPLCAARRLPPTKLNIFAQYLMRVRTNIHVVLCMSPLGEAFRTRLRMFPSIVNCCTIDWFAPWPDEALRSVAQRALGGEEGSDAASLNLGDQGAAVVAMVGYLHLSVATASEAYLQEANRHNYVTPTSYLELLSTYRTVLTAKRSDVGTLRDRLQVGLDKIISTQSQVGELQEQLKAMEPVLIKTQGEVEEMIVQVVRDKEDAARTQAEVEVAEADAQAKAAATKEIADDAQRDLDEALPALDAAVACLKDLKKSDVDEVKSLGKPPHGVKLTMEATCIMFGVKPEKVADPDNQGKKINDYFSAAKKTVLKDANKLLQDMQSFDKDNIPDKIIKAIDPFMTNPDFEPKAIEKASKACTAICMWVRAMHVYHNVALQVEPKRQLLAEKQIELDATLAELSGAQALLAETLAKVAALEAAFSEANAKKEKLTREVEECRARLDRAQKLIGGLGGEKDRWTESVVQLGADFDNLVGDGLISAAAIAYSGPFTPDFRSKLTLNWQNKLSALGIAHTLHCDLRTTLADPVAIRSWNIAGLPSDGHSIENGIIMSQARRYPLLVDPQGQANRYIKNMGKDPAFSINGLEAVKLTDKTFLRTLENGIRFGRWILLENIGETLDAVLEPLLLQQRFRQGGTDMIKVGDATIPWNDAFRFFMTTKLPNPHYAPEVCVKVSLVNFAITFTGLEDQLLGVAVVEEMPEMEERKNSLVVSNAKMKKELQEIENRILYLLSNSKGNILDDHELIDTLATSKKTSTEIKAKVAEAEATEKEIDASREGYRPVAYRGSVLYFCIRDLGVVDPMYQYSLQWFTSLFVAAIRQSEPRDELTDRLEELNAYFSYYVYINICRSLAERHKLLFSFFMAIKLMQAENRIDPAEWHFLMTGKPPVGEGGGTDDSHESTAKPAVDWIDERMWNDLQGANKLAGLAGLLKDVQSTEHAGSFKAIYDDPAPHRAALPGEWQDRLSSMQRLCLLRCIRADKIPDGVFDFVSKELGPSFVEPPPFDLGACFEDSTATTPLIFVLSKGSDPTKAFYQFAASMRFDKKVKGLSLGQGQGVKAARLLEEAMQKGTWVYLQNCHLYISWLSELERICEDLTPDTVHKDFRLWLTSMPCKEFPVSILQGAVKMTNEPPKGLRANLRSAYYKLDNSKLDMTSRPDVYKRLLFALCFFHASVQERRKFGPLGWNVPYEFNETDLDISKGQLAIFLDRGGGEGEDGVPYQVLRFLTSYINYGGRVTEYIDLRTIDVIMRTFYNPGVLTEGYCFDSNGTYRSVAYDPADPHRSYCDYIESLPLAAEPGVFGMHDNANISCALGETWAMFSAVTRMELGGGGGGAGAGAGTGVAPVARSIYERLAAIGLFDMESISMLYPTSYNESMNTVLVQECIRYNRLISIILRTLPELLRALQGLVVMNTELEAIASAIAIAAVPSDWEAAAYPSLKSLDAWVDDLLERLGFLRQWIELGTPSVFWISGFYFPQAFLTGTLQNYARKHGMPIDAVQFDFKVVDTPWHDIKSRPDDGAYIRGLFLEGARWNPEAHSIDNSRPKQLYTPMPVLHLEPLPDRKDPSSGVYRCPVYKVLSRRGTLSTTGHSTNFIMWVDVPSNREDFVNNMGQSDQDVWIKAGVALFCSLDF